MHGLGQECGGRRRSQHIEQADKGCDFDFLRSEFGPAVDEPVIY